jgi:WD40 repeat protein
VVENYPNPEALAERVRDDLWKLIDEAFPANEIPDPLTLERRRHEAYAASRRRLYLGGEHYFRALDDAMEGDPSKADFKPVLITGASGGGKSALLANWTARWSGSHPDTEVILHHLGCGADAADPVKLAVRLMQEIARITGEDFQPESDPEKQLGKLPEWLTKGSAWSERTGKGILLVLDGLDKVSDRTHLRWFPGFLPPGIRMVASCLDGEILQAATDRLPWTELRVEPLTDEGKRTLITKYLHELYRKSLTSDQIDRIIAHPLSGNPLFLKALLEELRIFGVFELLEARLEEYLSATTIDGLFAKVFARVEEDNSPEDVRAVMEILWGSLESFAEDELIGEHSVTGLAPAKWAPILIALDESLVSEQGRIALGHDYFRKAVEDRYLPTEEDKRRVLKKLSEFCAGAMESEGRKGNSPYVRRQAVRHFLLAEDWDRATDALSDLDYVEARVRNSELLPLLMDYSLAEKSLPEGEAERKLEEERQAELDRYAREMVEYAATWTRIREGSGEAEPIPPRPVPSVRLWTEEEIEAERIRRTDHPNRLDKVRAFKLFLSTNAAPMQKYSEQDGFIANLARNNAPAGPIHEEGERKLKAYDGIKLIKRFHPEEKYNPMPECIAVLEGHETWVKTVTMSLDGRRIISGSGDTTIRIWDTKSGACLKVLEGHEGPVRSVSVSADAKKIISGGDDINIRLWDAVNGKVIRIFEGHQDCVTAVSFNIDGSKFVSGSEDGSVRLWVAESGACLKILEGHKDSVKSVLISRDEKIIISGSWDNTIRIWAADTGECVKVLFGHTSTVLSLVFCEDERRIISGSGDNTVRIWDLDTGECIKILRGHESDVSSLALSADASRIASGSDDRTIRIWNLKTGDCQKVLQGHESSVWAVSFTTNGRHIISGGDESSLLFWDIESGIYMNSFIKAQSYVTSVDISNDGNRIVFGSYDNEGYVLDDVPKVNLRLLHGHESSVCSTTLSDDGKKIISGSWDKTLRVWNGDSGDCLLVLKRHQDSLTCVALSSDEKLIISGGLDGIIIIWNAISGEHLKTLTGHKGPVSSVAVSDDKMCIVSGSSDQSIRIWNVESGECVRVMEGHEDEVCSVALSANKKIVASGGRDSTLRIWDVDSGDCLKVLHGHEESVKSVYISEDASKVVSCALDNTIRIWDSVTRNCINFYYLKGLTCIGVQATFQRLVVGLKDGRVESFEIENLK